MIALRVQKRKQRVHSLTGRITEQLLLKAFNAVKRNRGAAGVDKVSIEMYETNLVANLNNLMKQLKADTYQPKPARRKYIPKGKNKFRPLGIPTVKRSIVPIVSKGRLQKKSFVPSSIQFLRKLFTTVPTALGNCVAALQP